MFNVVRVDLDVRRRLDGCQRRADHTFRHYHPGLLGLDGSQGAVSALRSFGRNRSRRRGELVTFPPGRRWPGWLLAFLHDCITGEVSCRIRALVPRYVLLEVTRLWKGFCSVRRSVVISRDRCPSRAGSTLWWYRYCWLWREIHRLIQSSVENSICSHNNVILRLSLERLPRSRSSRRGDCRLCCLHLPPIATVTIANWCNHVAVPSIQHRFSVRSLPAYRRDRWCG